MSEGLSVRVVRIAFGVAPRHLTAKEVADACPDDTSSNVFSTLSQQSKSEKSPLTKARNSAGVMEYWTNPAVDVEKWLKDREPKPGHAPDSSGGEPSGNEDVQVVRVLHAGERRMTAIEIYQNGNFESRAAMMLRLPKLSDGAESPLFREKVETGGRGSVAAFYYAIREGFDVDAWLAEHDDQDGATPAAGRMETPALQGAGPSGAARVVRGRDTSDVSASPAVSRAPSPAPAAKQEPPAHQPPPPPEPPKTEPDRRPEPEEPVITIQPLRAADACAELLRFAHEKLMEAAEVSSDPVVAKRAREVRVLNELRKDFERVPA